MFQVFDAEREAGLEDLLLKPIAFASQITTTKATNFDPTVLHHLESVLVTTGWNKNDDYFDPLHTWAARHSPEDTPFNFEHDQSDIIGHITGCRVVDDDYKVIADNTDPSDLPDKFHILTAAVLYKKWDNADLQTRMNSILAEIAKGEWFVSMECLFKNYDYLLVGKDNTRVVTARTNDSAFLTKHLRAYGGTGEYEGYKVKRLLRDIVFSGKGLVRNPANPESIIIHDNFVANANENRNHEAITVMANENKDLLSEQITELKAEVAMLRQERDEANTKAAEAAKAAVENEVSVLKAEIKARDTLVEELKTKIAATETSLNEKIKAADEASKSATAFETELKEMKLSQAKQDKVSKLVAAGMSHEDATAKAEKFVNASDEMFSEYVALVKTAAMSDDNDGEDDDDDDEAAAAAKAAQDALDSAKPNADVNLGGTGENRQKIAASLSTYLKTFKK